MFFCWLLFVFWPLAFSAIDSPRLYDFRKEDSTSEIRRYGNSSAIDYFRLLEVDGDYLIVGAADSVHNISIDRFDRVSTYEWKPGPKEMAECSMTADQSACRNFVRVLSRDDQTGRLLICGTNAYRPMCRIIEKNLTVSEFSGTGISPLDPRHNTTFYRENDFLYSATVADFSGSDSLIFRRNVSKGDQDYGLRTGRHNTMQLNKPQFVGALHSQKYVYFFFREEAMEAADSTTFSRVGRVCKNDTGGPGSHSTEWTTFLKARLNCSIPEKNKPFYFNEIISISNTSRWIDGREVVYATFVSEFNFLRHSVICAFDLAEIDRLFAKSDLLIRESDKWTTKSRSENERTAHLGECREEGKMPTEDDIYAARKFPLLAESAPNIFGRAVGIHRGSDHFNQIVVLESVPTQEGPVDILYVGTDQGNVIKMASLANRTQDDDPMVLIAVFELTTLPIRRLLIAKNEYLIVVTDPVVYRLPLHFCSSYSTCDQCVGSRDPHCFWLKGECSHSKDVKQKFVYQDILQRRPNVCAEARQLEKPTITTRTPPKVHLDRQKSEKRNFTFGAPTVDLSRCDCEAETTPLIRAKCNCPEQITGAVPVVADQIDESATIYRLPWWVLLIIVVALLQTVGMIALCCKLARRRRSPKKMPIPTMQMPKPSVINAYGPPMADSIPLRIGTMKRMSAGEMTIHIDPSMHY